ncbi:MAG: dihydrofolate reductase family protein [Candidatus Liptonbacteria bacterium]|nr:dihydrofolate reductase family protein [Candidatus Liptonbacteria bacterium]
MKVILYMAISANGFIARKDDDVPWSGSIFACYYDFVRKRGNIILGKRTYKIMKEVGEFEKLGFPLTVVVSDSPDKINNEKTIFVSSPKEAIKNLEERGVEEAIVGGGSILNSSFMAENLIDEIYLDVEPIIFGEGIPLFAAGDFEKKLELIEIKNISDNEIQLHYRVKRA